MSKCLLITLVLINFGCKNDINEKNKISDSNFSGEKIAKINCGRCHVFPEPDLLTKQIWKDRVLPEMAYYAGFKPLSEKMFATNEKDFFGLINCGYFSESRLLTIKDWEKIVDFYISNAPESLAEVKIVNYNYQKNLDYIKSIPKKDQLPFISMVKFENDTLYYAKANNNMLIMANEKIQTLTTYQFDSPIVDMEKKGNFIMALEIGMMNPNDRFLGKIVKLNCQKKSKEILIDSLNRPVDLNIKDINGDGFDDFIVCNFGNKMGSLTWYDGLNFKAHDIAKLPGARITSIEDADKDGDQDIYALFTQGNEKISMFINDGKGKFIEKVLLTFPPVFGSSYMEISDINSDGYKDIIYTAGDNADLSKILKPYHGLYVYLNDGHNSFSKAYFQPFNGASMARSIDIDNDNDLDVVITSYFPNPKQKQRILLLENNSVNGQAIFLPKSLSYSENNNWLVMDVNKNYTKLVFGAMQFYESNNNNNIELMILNKKQ